MIHGNYQKPLLFRFVMTTGPTLTPQLFVGKKVFCLFVTRWSFYHRQLGFSRGQATKESRYGSITSTFAMDDVACTGTEQRIRKGYKIDTQILDSKISLFFSIF